MSNGQPAVAGGGSINHVFDSRLVLAMNLAAQPGEYALLVGSGVSTGVGVPTGWGVVTELVRRVAAAAGDHVADDFDPEAWWTAHGAGTPLGYSGLLGALASTPAARRALLATFFEATDMDRAEGRKIPGPAHHAIAALVSRGSVRVIVTTNFDRLIEQALEAQNVMPQVVASPAAAVGMEPLPHARCTVLKLHGDYASLDQLNTVEELSTYAEETSSLLNRVLDEYGLIVNGWSGDWDVALVAAMERVKPRRYPMFWAAPGELGTTARNIVAAHRAHVISGAPAEIFFPDLVTRLEALDSVATPPLTVSMAVAQLKRMLPDPVKHIQLRDLVEHEVERIRSYLAARSQMPPSSDPEALADAHESMRREADPMLHLLANGIYLDRDRQHTALWTWTIEQLMRARRVGDGQTVAWWDNLQHYPALLALRTGCLAALAARHEDVVVALLSEPSWHDRFGQHRSVRACTALHDWTVLEPGILNSFWLSGSAKWHYPASNLLRATLASLLTPFVGDPDSYRQLCSRVEYRIALAQTLFDTGDGFGNRPAPGEFIGDGQWSRPDGRLVWEDDFLASGDRTAWGFDNDRGMELSTRLQELADMIRPMRQGF